MEYDQIAKLAQACFQSNPTIVLGSGASMPHGLPSMGDLSKFLQENISPVDANEAKQWKRVQDDLSAGLHLEGALDGKALSADLLKQIVAATWQCVNEKDKKLFFDLAEQPIAFDLGRLFRNLFRSTITKIDVVTTNYDRVVEYACNSVGLMFQDLHLVISKNGKPLLVLRTREGGWLRGRSKSGKYMVHWIGSKLATMRSKGSQLLNFLVDNYHCPSSK